MSIEPISPETIDTIHETANAIYAAKGYSVTIKREDVEVVLQATRLWNSVLRGEDAG